MSTCALHLRITPGTDAVHRVVCLCHRRHVEIISLQYAASDIDLIVRDPGARLEQLSHWLAALVEVLGVTVVTAVPVAEGAGR
jgi:hypothetical protein